MKKVNLGKTGLQVPAVAVGCMRMNDLSQGEAERFLSGALDMDAVFFDHADIYGAGNARRCSVNSCRRIRERETSCSCSPNAVSYPARCMTAPVSICLLYTSPSPRD